MSSDDTGPASKYQVPAMAGRPITTDKALGARIKRAREAARLSQLDLAQAVEPTVTDAAVSQWERNGRVKTSNLKQLPKILGVSTEWLYEGRGEMKPPRNVTRSGESESDSIDSRKDDSVKSTDLSGFADAYNRGARDLPIMGQAAAGDGSGLNNDGQPVGWTLRPPELIGVPNAYAFYIHDDCLEPVRWQGQVSCVHPAMPPQPNDIVVVQIGPDPDGKEGYREIVKAYVRTTASKLVLRQYNPPEDIEIDRRLVKAVHVEVANYRRA